jgi:hypothetical protein
MLEKMESLVLKIDQKIKDKKMLDRNNDNCPEGK